MYQQGSGPCINPGRKLSPCITHSGDKCQITAVLAVTMMGKYFPLQLNISRKDKPLSPSDDILREWDIWYTESHWSTKHFFQYTSNIILPFVAKLREDFSWTPQHWSCLTASGDRQLLILLWCWVKITSVLYRYHLAIQMDYNQLTYLWTNPSKTYCDMPSCRYVMSNFWT
jgi:hypothetical protein